MTMSGRRLHNNPHVASEPVPQGSIHRLKMKQGARIPAHAHPADEYVYVLSGVLTTGGLKCERGCFWIIPAGTGRL